MFEKEHEKLIKTLVSKGISNPDVLSVMGRVERHLFIPEQYRQWSYEDMALSIGEEQTISQPYTVAFMTEMLLPLQGKKVLEIGTGSGYQAAILETLGFNVISIERNIVLYERTRELFQRLGLNTNLLYGDGSIGMENYAPFDGIIVTAASPTVPESLKAQLSTGGKIVIPVGDLRSQSLMLLTKKSENRFEINEIPNFEFVPLIGEEGWKNV